MKTFWFVVRVVYAAWVFAVEMVLFLLMRTGFLDFWTAAGLGVVLLFGYMLSTVPIGNNKLSW